MGTIDGSQRRMKYTYDVAMHAADRAKCPSRVATRPSSNNNVKALGALYPGMT